MAGTSTFQLVTLTREAGRNTLNRISRTFTSNPTTHGYQPLPTRDNDDRTTRASKRAAALNRRRPSAPKPPLGSKVEPKVYFAAERTYLNWLRISFLLAAFALALFNGSKSSSNPFGQIFGFIYALIAIGVLLYGYYLFNKRMKNIKETSAAKDAFSEITGPLLVCLALFTAVLINFILSVRNRANKNPNPGEGHQPPKSPWMVIASAFQSSN